jgi:hypothetical protein
MTPKHSAAPAGQAKTRRLLLAGAATLPLLLAACNASLPSMPAFLAGPPPQTVQCTVTRTARPADASPALVQQEYGASHTPIPVNAVSFTHEGLAAHVGVQALFAGRTDTGTVQVSARLVNCTDQAIVLRARTSFLLRSTAPAEPASAWQPVFLPARATTVYQERSLSMDGVASYLIEIAPEAP